jgi:hypothetical protein
MRTHVFIVNEETFPKHLQYMFVGTGSKDKDEHPGLLTDISRVRIGDFVIFYIEGTVKIKGGFYGIFQIADAHPLVFHAPEEDGFQPSLSKKLIYRALFKPYEVYSKGISEWEALDKLPMYATEIQWSLIYRKLKGQRGCTPLLPWEAQRLIDMIRNKNSGKPIANQDHKVGFDWDNTNRIITLTSSPKFYNLPRKETIDPLPFICKKSANKRAYEIYLELYFTQNAGLHNSLNPIVGDNIIWLGNEVSSGVGMQKIDILTINQSGERKDYRIIELKDESVDPGVVEQIEYYVNWASQKSGRHLEVAYNWNIRPIIVAPPHKSSNWKDVIKAFLDFNNRNISLPILYFEFQVQCGKSINFQRIDYE